MKDYKYLEKVFKEAILLNHTCAILHWDTETMMPHGSSEHRGEQLAYLAKLAHKKIFNNKVKDAILNAETQSYSLNEWQQANLREMKKTYDETASVPIKLNEKFITVSNKCESKLNTCK